ncbi:hypothetical protein [Streptomyces hesseae]|uniref:MarR family transcriptional regulator n=1 Tax=Streptomyces hesseae TaxID=3075519 RepID=A0ABU2SWQ0_9ACTN|nr:hypothetical protein [Streptomyces sp. DSM 40473]MDT0453432.1 hypothetical protein [Streptomyces sp. DSM 40473]
MAVANSSAVLPTPAHPMANPGYGKRVAPDQAPRTANDFAHLPRREASIAAFIDRLPEGAAMDAKTLAKVLPDYGQQACSSALRYLREVGHVFFRPVAKKTKTGVRRVTRTFFSRTARPKAWWERLLRGDVPSVEQPAPEPEPEPAPEPTPEPRRSRAYRALASLGRTDPKLTLSAAECAELEPLAAQWLALDTTPEQMTAALTAGLPTVVHVPVRFLRDRLERKMPPVPLRFVPAYNDRSAPDPTERAVSIGACICCSGVDIATAAGDGECAKCAQVPDVPDTFLSEDCWGGGEDSWDGLSPEEITRRVDVLRAAAGIARKGGV